MGFFYSIVSRHMDTLSFVVELTKALAWPIAGVTISLIFRKEFRGLLDRMKRSKVGFAEFEFEEVVATLKAESSGVSLEPTATEIDRTVLALIDLNPRQAILNSWVGVESAAIRLAEVSLKLEPVLARSPLLAMRAATHRQIVDSKYLEVFNELRSLRNKAAHEAGFSPTRSSVLSFVELSSELTSVLQSAANVG